MRTVACPSSLAPAAVCRLRARAGSSRRRSSPCSRTIACDISSQCAGASALPASSRSIGWWTRCRAFIARQRSRRRRFPLPGSSDGLTGDRHHSRRGPSRAGAFSESSEEDRVSSLQSAVVGPLSRRPPGLLVGGIATAAVAFGLGATLAALASLFGDASPAVFVAVPVVPIVTLGILAAPVLAPIVVFAVFPIGSAGVPGVPLQSVEFAVLAIATVVAVRRLALGQVPLTWQPPLAWAMALLVWTIVGLQSSIDNTLALKQIGSLSGGIIFAALIVVACRNMAELRMILGAFLAVTAGIAVASFAGGVQLHSAYGTSPVGGRLQGAFDHPNQLGAFCAMGIAIGVGLAFGARRALARTAAAAATLVILAALMFTL